MKFYIVDDEPAILYVLQNIIEQKYDDEIVGINDSSLAALRELAVKKVDIVLIDLLMPTLSGIDLVRQVKKLNPGVRFIMISKVQDSDMRAAAYQAGIEFFINKPINIIEVQSVINKVKQNIRMSTQLASISKMLNNFNETPPSLNTSGHQQVNTTLNYLGMSSEKGTADILQFTSLMLSQEKNYRELDLATIGISDHQRKVMEQRIRRAIKVGLSNTANRLIDNPYDEQLSTLASLLFGYDNVRAQMLYQQGKKKTGGRITIPKFIDGLIAKQS
ncbi:response regulator [Lactobacillaceae bacterium 24-114]